MPSGERAFSEPSLGSGAGFRRDEPRAPPRSCFSRTEAEPRGSRAGVVTSCGERTAPGARVLTGVCRELAAQ